MQSINKKEAKGGSADSDDDGTVSYLTTTTIYSLVLTLLSTSIANLNSYYNIRDPRISGPGRCVGSHYFCAGDMCRCVRITAKL